MTSMQGYDDGTGAIPDGLDGPVERVIVIGAGIAGLTAANALHHAGVPCVVLEGRDRIGGRLHTVDVGGSPVDMGGSWIHTPVGNPMTAWADQVGIEHRPANVLAYTSGWDPDRGPIDLETFQRLLGESWRSMDTVLASGAGLEPRTSVATAIDAWVAGRPGDPVEREWLRRIARRGAEQDSAADAELMAASQPDSNTVEYEGDYLGDMIVGGYGQLVEAMASGLDIRRGWPVAAIETGTTGIRTTSADGSTETGSHLLVTVPLGVLKSGSIRFDPPLPAERRAAITRLGMGRFEKVALRFERPFWTEAGLSSVMILGPDHEPDFVIAFGLDGPVDEPVVLGFTMASHVGIASDVPEAESVSRLIEILGQATGVSVPTPTATARSSWGSDPLSRGAYAYVAMGSSLADLDELGLPIGGRLLFAGEATSSVRCGFADGALTSGIREAKRLLGQASVDLGVIDPS